MLALPRPGWFNESSAASDALEVFDPIVPLQVLHQASLLGEGFRAQCAVVVLNARVDLFMSCPHVGEPHPGLATFEPAGVLLFSFVKANMALERVLAVKGLPADGAVVRVLGVGHPLAPMAKLFPWELVVGQDLPGLCPRGDHHPLLVDSRLLHPLVLLWM